MANRGFNFGAGPATLPEAVLQEVQNELLNWRDQGMSILEIGHRTSAFKDLLAEIEEDLRQLLHIPQDYAVLFLGGTARSHFSLIPLHFLSPGQKAGYLVSGLWSKLAFEEAAHYSAYTAANSESEQSNHFFYFPPRDSWKVQSDSAYLFYTSNETVNGVRAYETPTVGEIPLIADMTSSLLTEPLKINAYDFIFAGVQKNIANAGMSIALIKRDFLNKYPNSAHIPAVFNYRVQDENNSLYATPPTFNCYLAGKMFKWIKNQGGLEALYHQNQTKSAMLYNFIDESPEYGCRVQPLSRSLVNVCFYLKKSALEPVFLSKAKEKGLLALQGHRTVGGLRASLYNAMPLSGVKALIAFMQEFAEDYLK